MSSDTAILRPSLEERLALVNGLIAGEIGAGERQVSAAVALLDEGATVPFIARYRKEVTGGLDDTQLRTLEARLVYLRDMEARRETILNSIEEQGKLTVDLAGEILAADNKSRLEDLYLPYKPKRRTKGQIAREAGIEPLALLLWQEPAHDPETEAAAFINEEKGFADTKSVLEGARYILMEQFAEDAQVLGQIRTYLEKNGIIRAKVMEGKEEEGAKFSDYFDHWENLARTPSHRALALLRGQKEGILSLNMVTNPDLVEDPAMPDPCEAMIAKHFNIKDLGRPADAFLQKVVTWTWRVKISLHLEADLIGQMREAAEGVAIQVFAKNLKDLLMAAPAGPMPTMGLDPGLRTGVKVAIVDDTGKFVAQDTIYPHPPKRDWQGSLSTLAKLCKAYKVKLISIGNGTGSRETDKLAADLMAAHPELGLRKIMVNEAGASIYSASELAAKEFPDLDVSIRGAVSIARRLQDPLAELVKIEPKSIGVGQYQHDVNQIQLAQSLDAVVEDCVNGVGVDLNMASPPLLARVSGLNRTLADNIVTFRNEHGRFRDRKQLMKVPRLGSKTFEQAAGFLRIAGGDNPLDASAVHPEAYPVVSRMSQQAGIGLDKMIGNKDLLKTLNPSQFVDDRFGLPTVTDIINELEKPGRDPRGSFKTAQYAEGIEDIKDLHPGMKLEGTVTNVTNFGAFVDVGVHQDGLVHISQLADRFVQDPREVVKAGDIVKVHVLEVDVKRRRISLSMRDPEKPAPAPKKREERQPKAKPASTGSMAEALKSAWGGRR